MRHSFTALLVTCGLTVTLAAPLTAAEAAPAAPNASTSTGSTSTGSTSTGSTSTGSVVTAALAPRPNQRWRVPMGAKFNNPMVPEKRFVIERHVLRAIRNTPRGEKITISAYSMDRPVFADELIRARKRGVQVQVLLNDHQAPKPQRRIQKVVGWNTRKGSFLKRCHAGCRADANEYNNLHSKFYLFSRTGRNRNVVMLGSYNMTRNAVRWQWNDLYTMVGKKTLYQQYRQLFNDMRPDWDKRRATYTFCDDGRDCPAGDMQKYHTVVFPRYTTPERDVVLDLLDDVQCRYTDASGTRRRTMLRLSMHTMRGKRGNYIADRLRQLYGEGCNLKVNYGLMGYHTKKHLGRPTSRGRVPLRSTGFSLVDDAEPGRPENIERYTHHKYFVLKGSYKGKRDAHVVWTGSTNWSSLGTPQDEILFTVHGRGVVRDYLKNFDLMWHKPYSRNAYTTTYSSWRSAGGTTGGRMVTIEPDDLRGRGETWEND